MPKKAPTLQTIADRAGVSKNTVSCALRADPRISKNTRDKIRIIAAEVGYRPNPMVSALMQSLRQSHPVAKSANLAFIQSLTGADDWRRRTYYSRLFEGAEARANEMGYNLTPIWGAEPDMTPQRFTGILRSRNVMGLVIGPMGFAGPLPIEWDRYPMAAMGTSLAEPQLHRAATYFSHAIPRAWQELRAMGYQRIGVIFAEHANRRVDYALEAGCAVLSSSMDVDPLPVLRRDDLTADEFRQWIEEHKIDAVIAGFTYHLGALTKEIGLKIPENFGLVSLLSERSNSPGAVIVRDWKAIGAATVDLVVGQLWRNERGVPATPKTVMIEGEWDPGPLAKRLASS